MTNNILDGLNPQQLEAVTLPHQSALVLAGAGSGKTRVLTTRIAHLLSTGQAEPRAIAAVTFTNKAAKEMTVRLQAMINLSVRHMWLGTFHGLANRLLRLHHQAAGLPPTFQILDMNDQQSLIKRMVKALEVDDEKYPPKRLAAFINANKDKGLRAAQVVPEEPDEIAMRDFYAQYDEQCRREGVVDFAELLLRSFELLRDDEALRNHYRERFRHILVDEFQDTSELQYKWLKLLCSPDTAIFAVGDDDQAIYGWRGANVGNMYALEKDFRVPKIIRLEQNYRSHGNILDAANHLISKNGGRLGKNLWTQDAAGEPIRLYQAADDRDEATYLVDEAKNLHRAGMPLSDIAFLYRSNAQSRVLEHALFTAGVPYRVYGGLRYFERQEIKHALAYLRLVANANDDVSFLRVVNIPARGIGPKSVEQLGDAARASGTSLMEAARFNFLSGKACLAARGFVALVEAMTKACRDQPLSRQVEIVLETSGLYAYFETEKDGEDRLANLKELVQAAATYTEEDAAADGVDPLTGFLTHASLEAGEHGAEAGEDALQLMTVHAAKGLEFQAVFVSGLEEGLFPHDNSKLNKDGVEEERRLMYVAITRARRYLYLTYAGRRMLNNQPRYGVPSRFIEELPAAVLKPINTVLPGGGAGVYAGRAGGNPYGQSRANPWGQDGAGRGERRPYGGKSYSGYQRQGANVPGPDTPSPAELPPAWARERESDEGTFRIGMKVSHPKFGAGRIVNLEGVAPDLRVQVKFSDAGHGVKWLALKFAKLTPLD